MRWVCASLVCFADSALSRSCLDDQFGLKFLAKSPYSLVQQQYQTYVFVGYNLLLERAQFVSSEFRICL